LAIQQQQHNLSVEGFRMNDGSYIPFHLPEIGEEEIQEVVATLRSGWLTTGRRTQQFEQEFRDYTGCNHALAVSSGTAAIHLALAALGIGPGDEVITTPLTFCATVASIIHLGATPVLSDVGADGNIDPQSIAKKITNRTRAILPVHLAGAPCDMNAIWSLAKEHGLFVVEDAAHAAGTEYNGHHVGARELASDAVAFSFYATKNLTTGEGGMVTTNRQDLADRMKLLCLHGIDRGAWDRYTERGSWYYQVIDAGYKYNLSDIQSALGIHQLRKLERFTARRTEIANYYNAEFAGIDELELPQPVENGRHAWHIYMLRLNLHMLNINRADFISEIRSKGVGASVHFIPIPLHPFFERWSASADGDCVRALEMYPRMVSLPIYPMLSDVQTERVVAAVKEVVWASRRIPGTELVLSQSAQA
jgi:dTDP-4-amino-4,6-dideoxygalactose transaminase